MDQDKSGDRIEEGNRVGCTGRISMLSNCVPIRATKQTFGTTVRTCTSCGRSVCVALISRSEETLGLLLNIKINCTTEMVFAL